MPDGAARLPDFFIVGVPKSGTTSLYHYLSQHPQIYLSPIKEPSFFAAEDLLSEPLSAHVRDRVARDHAALQFYLRGDMRMRLHDRLVLAWEDYLKLFRNVGSEAAIGEASAAYSYLPSAAGAIRARIPGARIIMILRDPAQRAFAQYQAADWKGTFPSFRSFFLDAASQPGLASLWLEIGKYGTHVRRFFDNFPPGQVRIYLYEDLWRNPNHTIPDILGFLGVDPGCPLDLSQRFNEPGMARIPAAASAAGRLHRLVRWRRFPEPVHKVFRAMFFRPPRTDWMNPEDRKMVIDYYSDEILLVSRLIGRDLSPWLDKDWSDGRPVEPSPTAFYQEQAEP